MSAKTKIVDVIAWFDSYIERNGIYGKDGFAPRDAVSELIAAAKGFDRFYSDIWNREDGSLLVAPGNAEKLEEAFNRMQAALARIGGAP